ncbi:MAG: hypothetical protein P4L40_12420 [Terracidiphilus sp.]|nr:hypothetical protein [Terracidiphilus sp.]
MRIRLPLALLALVFSVTAPAQQPEKGTWRAASNTAASITGDVALSGSKISINFVSFLISPVRPIKPAEVAAVFDEAVDTAGNGQLYRVNIPATRRFVSHNTLCGSQDTEWMAAYVANGALKLAFFSGEEVPVMTFEAMQNSAALCSTFTYVR